MLLQWTMSAYCDLVRLHAFLQPVNPRDAIQVVQQLGGGTAFNLSAAWRASCRVFTAQCTAINRR